MGKRSKIKQRNFISVTHFGALLLTAHGNTSNSKQFTIPFKLKQFGNACPSVAHNSETEKSQEYLAP